MNLASKAALIRHAAQHGDAFATEAATRAYAGALLRAAAARAMRSSWRRAVALGPLLPLAAMTAGLLFQDLAALAFQTIPAILVLTLTCGLLGMAGLPLRVTLGRTVLLIVVAIGVAAPVIGWVLAGAVGATAEERAWVALASAAPVGSAALGAALALSLPCATVAGSVILSLIAAPVLLPLAAAAIGAEAGIAPGPLALRLLLLAGLPVLVALALRQVPALARPVPRVRFAEVALVALAVLALARMHGVRDTVAADPLAAARLFGLALLPVLAGALAVWLVLRRDAGAEALLAGGFRNVAIVWAATAHMLPPEGGLFMALTALPIYALPALVRARMRAGAGMRPA
ncbi:MAG TPA: hypothetical protein VE033_04845 [Acetobacteraceae bacterium]|nr:hypothetical protein [Acetobacteraceae bacterium]